MSVPPPGVVGRLGGRYEKLWGLPLKGMQPTQHVVIVVSVPPPGVVGRLGGRYEKLVVLPLEGMQPASSCRFQSACTTPKGGGPAGWSI